MKTVIVLSDTHGNKNVILKLFPLFEENDYIIHLGDGGTDMQEVYKAFPDKTFVCRGNCDFSAPSFSQNEYELTIENVKILCCHGHKYHVKSGYDEYEREAKTRGCGVALFGHTHEAYLKQEKGFTLMNPGCATPFSTELSYGYLVINGDKVTATTVPIYR